jgi:hypothetical protein
VQTAVVKRLLGGGGGRVEGISFDVICMSKLAIRFSEIWD